MPSHAADEMSSPPPYCPIPAAVPGYTDTGAFVYTVEYQQFCVEARKLFKEAQPGLKKKKLRKKIEKLWFEARPAAFPGLSLSEKRTADASSSVRPQKHPSEVEPDEEPVSGAGLVAAAAAPSKLGKPKAPQSRSTSAASSKPTSSTAEMQTQSQPAEQDWEDETSDEGTPLGAHRMWGAVEDDQ